MNNIKDIEHEYAYFDSLPTWGSSYLWPILKQIVAQHSLQGQSALELGCGNGAGCNFLHGLGLRVTGVDPSPSGVRIAKESFPQCQFHQGSGYDDLREKLGDFQVLVCLEVLSHCQYPRVVLRTIYDLLVPGGIVILSVPYHGYLKNLALAASGRLDRHFNALWDNGPLKFFSRHTLEKLLQETGFSQLAFRRAGRIPALANSVVVVARKQIIPDCTVP